MCKLYGHSIFSYQTWRGRKGINKLAYGDEIDKLNAKAKKAKEETEELNKPMSNEVEGEMPIPVTPIKTTGTGLNNSSKLRFGLNL